MTTHEDRMLCIIDVMTTIAHAYGCMIDVERPALFAYGCADYAPDDANIVLSYKRGNFTLRRALGSIRVLQHVSMAALMDVCEHIATEASETSQHVR